MNQSAVKVEGVQEMRQLLAGMGGLAQRVLVPAINKTVAGGVTDSVNEISREVNLTKTRIRKDFSKILCSYVTLNGRIDSTGKPVELINFRRTRQTAKGVSVIVKPKSGRKVIPHAFVSTMGSGHKGAFWRAYKGPRSNKTKKQLKKIPWAAMPKKFRLPIKELYGPRIQDVMDDPLVMRRILSKTEDRLTKNLAYEYNRQMAKL